ncbi:MULTISPECIES: hypothetical protein [unclassified Streptomyces]|uniref:hypothetical protein n=1 Tax=unclassified Streptomyces TaxID=2593676 RepID=UPI002033AE64|nr:hypothetical protein [Streptomyces sp. RKAG290]MCM2413972.1 hypothetical protein [Streptomyces sp. RKAG290]
MPAPVPPAHPEPAAQSATDVVRWSLFGCLLVPVVLLAHGDSAGGAAVVALGLAVVTVTCRMLLRRSLRSAARTSEGAHRSGRSSRGVRRLND